MSKRLKDVTAYEAANMYWKELDVASRDWRRAARKLGLDVSPPETEKRRTERDVPILNHLGRLVRRWEEKGLVRHVVLKEGSEAAERLERVPQLEEELRRLFPLRHTVVCDISHLTDVDDRVREDTIHQRLGEWGGRILNVCLRGDDEVLGTGGGRGPHYTVLACRFRRGVDYPKKVVSLTGRISATDWAHKSNITLDADQVAGHLAGHLNARELVRLRSDIVPGTDRPEIPTHTVTFALTGVGSLAGGHRLLNFEECVELAPIRDELGKLRKLLAKIEGSRTRKGRPVNHWVGDLCNYLFVCEPPTQARRTTRKDIQDLHDLIGLLNTKLLSPKLDQMRDICRRGGVMAVCGGRHKTIPIWHLLRRPEPVISHLITDSTTAEQICALEKAAIDSLPIDSKRPHQSSTE